MGRVSETQRLLHGPRLLTRSSSATGWSWAAKARLVSISPPPTAAGEWFDNHRRRWRNAPPSATRTAHAPLKLTFKTEPSLDACVDRASIFFPFAGPCVAAIRLENFLSYSHSEIQTAVPCALGLRLRAPSCRRRRRRGPSAGSSLPWPAAAAAAATRRCRRSGGRRTARARRPAAPAPARPPPPPVPPLPPALAPPPPAAGGAAAVAVSSFCCSEAAKAVFCSSWRCA